VKKEESICDKPVIPTDVQDISGLTLPKYAIWDVVRTSIYDTDANWVVVGMEYIVKDGFIYKLRKAMMNHGSFNVFEHEIVCVMQSFREFIENFQKTQPKCQ
jgi:hypothetical protein